MEAVLDVEISWKFEASTMKNRGENEKWKIVEKKKKKKKKETLRKQKGLPMKSEDLKYLRHFLTDLAEIFRVVLKCQYLDVKWATGQYLKFWTLKKKLRNILNIWSVISSKR